MEESGRQGGKEEGEIDRGGGGGGRREREREREKVIVERIM